MLFGSTTDNRLVNDKVYLLGRADTATGRTLGLATARDINTRVCEACAA